MAKYQEICEILSSRIENGDYAGGRIPPLRKLAEDMGVSYLTARQAVNSLKEKGIVSGSTSGRQTLVGAAETTRPLVAFITPFWYYTEWHMGISEEVGKAGGQLRIFAYSTPTDPIINEALNGDFDLFFINLPDNPNPRLLERIVKLKNRAIVLFQDKTELGIKSVVGAPLDTIGLFIKKLKNAGTKRIDMIMPEQKNNADLAARKRIWEKYIAKYNQTGTLYSYPIKEFKRNLFSAQKYCFEMLENHPLPDAFFCATQDAALGLYRACYEKNIRIGKDLSVFCFGATEDCMLMTPALATVVNCGVPELLRKIISQYKPGGKIQDQLLYKLEEMELFEGESLNISEGKKRK